ncbi:hypothetical protein OGH69_07040 [Flavobacterium sp. MFBS3-15]|uniref:hypothetical protein n=1 Tax=Flavobacterium sp. MFBS3-15 TaxID=2989816 RepID=UPI002235868C|nr:hypothetical protein [Flavobacterium sp. MFBS3-15]MCW4468710.1 hypothetical protein [Flavobacterium sp. MFBS3-15]
MKKITLLALAAMTAFACSDDDSSNNAPPDGTWKLTYIDLNHPPQDINGDGTGSENYRRNCLHYRFKDRFWNWQYSSFPPCIAFRKTRMKMSR